MDKKGMDANHHFCSCILIYKYAKKRGSVADRLLDGEQHGRKRMRRIILFRSCRNYFFQNFYINILKFINVKTTAASLVLA